MSTALDAGGFRDPADYWAEPGYLAALDDTDPGPDELDGPAGKVFEHLVERRAQSLRIDTEARRRVRAEHTADPPPAQLLTDFLAIADDPVRYRIAGLLPVGGRALLAAQYKAGKSTMAGNLVRALTDGATFLGRHVERPPGRVVLIDDELDARMLRTWLRDQQIRCTDRAAVIPLRGRVSSFNIIDPAVRAQWAATLRDLQPDFVILDCLRPVLDAIGLDEDKEAGLFLVAFDELLAEAGAGEAVVVHHMGHAGERSRGSSRLRDWPDVEWRLVRQDIDDPSSARYFSAYGRDVDIPEAELGYNAETRQLHVIGGNRRDAESRSLGAVLVGILTERSALTGSECEWALMENGASRGKARDAVKMAVSEGKVITGYGRGRAVLHYPAGADPIPRDDLHQGEPPTPLFDVSAAHSGEPLNRRSPADQPTEDDHRSAVSDSRERAGQDGEAPNRREPPTPPRTSPPTPPTGRGGRRIGNEHTPNTEDPPPDDLECARCGYSATRLIGDRCPTCAYPSDIPPENEHEE